MTAEQSVPTKDQVIAKFRESLPVYAKNLLKITDKKGRMVPFRFNQAQKIAHAKIEDMKRRKGKVRVLILKARQQGISTYAEARAFWLATKSKHHNSFVLSHMDESTTNIFQMVARYYDNIDNPLFKPPLKQRTTKTLHFEGIDSKFRVGTARSSGTSTSRATR